MPPSPCAPMVANRSALAPSGEGTREGLDAVPVEVILDEVDQREIRLGARRVEADERARAGPVLSIGKPTRELLCVRRRGRKRARWPDGTARRTAPPIWLAFKASSSRSRGGALVTSESISSRAARETLSTAPIEGDLIGLGRPGEAAQLADELQGGQVDFFLRGGRVKIVQRLDIATHDRPHSMAAPLPKGWHTGETQASRGQADGAFGVSAPRPAPGRDRP